MFFSPKKTSAHTILTHSLLSYCCRLRLMRLPTFFAQSVAYPLIVGLHVPHSSTGSCQSLFYACANILCVFSLKPGETTTNRTGGMGIAVPYFWQSIYCTIGIHCHVIGVDAAKTGVPGLNSI